MAIGCNPCNRTGFINIPQDIDFSQMDNEEMLVFMKEHESEYPDFQVCHCCGNGEDWYGEPGSHYTSLDPIGHNGPYAYNGGLCECH